MSSPAGMTRRSPGNSSLIAARRRSLKSATSARCPVERRLRRSPARPDEVTERLRARAPRAVACALLQRLLGALAVDASAESVMGPSSHPAQVRRAPRSRVQRVSEIAAERSHACFRAPRRRVGRDGYRPPYAQQRLGRHGRTGRAAASGSRGRHRRGRSDRPRHHAGWAEASDAVGSTGVALVRGTEISTEAGGIGVHLLSYLHDPDDAGLTAMWDRSRHSRERRARHMVERIAEDLPLTWEDVLAQAGDGATIGRPHIADALVARGYAPDRSAAFRTILRSGGPYYVRYWAPSTTDAIAAVRHAGGVAVMAHPRASTRGRVVSSETIRGMAEARPRGAGDRPPGPHARRPGGSARARRRAGAACHRVERLSRHGQAEPAG